MKEKQKMKRKWRCRGAMPVVMTVFSLLAALVLGSGSAFAGAGKALSTNADNTPKTVDTFYANSPAGIWTDWQGTTHDSGTALTKFVDQLPLLCQNLGGNSCTATNYLPIAIPDMTKYPGSAYYEIAVVEYRQKMHTNLPAPGTRLRGYVQIEPPGYTGTDSRHVALTYPNGSPILDLAGNQVYAFDNPRYLGPIILASKGTPVRIKYMNLLPVGSDGDLFIPVDKTLMGAGLGPDTTTFYTENRIAIHHHGGDTPWISDGTPNQWTNPVGENAKYQTGDSFQIVPDMPDPGKGKGAGTLYYTNDISGRLMFYHDHALGTTRLNVYAGMAAGYLLTDTSEGAIMSLADNIPLIIQDRTFVPKDIAQQDSRWDTNHWGSYGDLWFPNVYEFNQDLTSADLTNPPGRWDYGPYFWPVFPVAPGYVIPDGTWDTANNRSNATTTPEAFADTMTVNGIAYPTVTLEPKPYRFRILNAGNDRFVNLGLFEAKQAIDCSSISGGTGYAVGDVLTFTDGLDATVPNAQPATAQVTAVNAGAITGFTMLSFGTYSAVPTLTTAVDVNGNPTSSNDATFTCALSDKTEVAMVPFDSSTPGIPTKGGLLDSGWGTQVGSLFPMGVPSPATIGPPFIQIGTEGGLLPSTATIPSTITNYEYNKRSVTVLNIFEHGLLMGNAERADAIVDFTGKAGKTYILYNDAPAPVPAGDPRIDYYTGNPDFTDSGGAPTTRPGQGPNTRTVMQIVIAGSPTNPKDLTNIKSEVEAAYAATQPKPVVAQEFYNAAFGTSYNNQFATIRTGTLYQPTFDFIAGSDISYYGFKPNVTPLTIDTVRTNVPEGGQAKVPVQNKAIQELFDPWGRMNATLGVELPFTNGQNQTTVPLTYIDPATERIEDGETQIWKITHNGVDTHPVHFHLVNVQLINRVGWDGTLKAPDANELGWKETIRMNPLEDVIVAVRANAPKLPFGVPTSTRNLSPSEPVGSTMSFSNLDPLTGNQFNPPVENQPYNFEWEYVWHCHILGHEENDFMRPFIFKYFPVIPDAPTGVAKNSETPNPLSVKIQWVDPTPIDYAADTTHATYGLPKNEIGFRIERCAGASCTDFAPVGTAVANATSFVDTAGFTITDYRYKVVAYNAAGETASAPAAVTIDSPIVGTCGASNGGIFTVAPTTDLCSVGTATAVSGTGPWTWMCTGFNGGGSASCSADIQTYTLIFTTSGNGTLSGNTFQTVNYGANSTAVTATPGVGYRLASWVDTNNNVLSTLPSLTVTNVQADATYTAKFYVDKDFTLDGKTDILWHNTSSGAVRVWAMNGTSRLGTVTLKSEPSTSWKAVATGDFNADGNTDILWRNQTTGQNRIWLMNGTTYVSTVSTNTKTGGYEIVGTGDFTGDGKVDILWRNNSTGANQLWPMNGVVQTGVTNLNPKTGTGWRIVGTGDFTGDGKVDILWWNNTTGAMQVWPMNGTVQTGVINLTTEPDLTWQPVSAADYDGDGKPDIVWRRTSTGENRIWLMNGTVQKGGNPVSLPTDATASWMIVTK